VPTPLAGCDATHLVTLMTVPGDHNIFHYARLGIAVLNGRIAGAFIVGEPHLPGCAPRHFYDEALFAAIPADHALASRTRLAWEDLRDETLLVMADGSGPEVEGIIARHISCLGFRPEIAVIPCNTASTLSLASLRAAYPRTPFVGTVPAVKPAAERTRSGLVSVLATPGTVKRQYTRDLIAQWAQECHVRLVGSTQLARLAGTYMRHGFVDEEAVRAEIAPCFIEQDGRRTDIVVLACTHYPFLANRMRKTAPWPVDWLDPAEAIARRALSRLAPSAAHGDTRPEPRDLAVFTSGKADFATRRLMQGFGLSLEE